MLIEHKTWKWFAPALGAVACGYGGGYLVELGMGGWGSLLVLLCLLCVFAAVTNYWRVVSDHRVGLLRERQEAMCVTPTVLLAQAIRSMHPEAVRVLDKFGVRTVWGVKVNTETRERDWILLGTDPGVHFGFVEYVLKHSGRALLPKNRFSEGSKKWDPDGFAEDREQYAELEKWMFTRLMVTRSHGDFKPAEFLPPWTPESIMEVMGLTGEQELFAPEGPSSAADASAQDGRLPKSVTLALEGLERTELMRSRVRQ